MCRVVRISSSFVLLTQCVVPALYVNEEWVTLPHWEQCHLHCILPHLLQDVCNRNPEKVVAVKNTISDPIYDVLYLHLL